MRSPRPSLPATHILTLRPDNQYDFESGTSVAAAEMTGIIALLTSSTDSHLTTSAIVSLLKETSDTPSSASTTLSSINVNAALAKLGVEQHRGRMASHAAH
jgi:subtilisin family serine protease